MADKNRAFLLYGSYAKQINKLTDEEAGALFKKVFDCVNDEDSEIKLSPLADMVFSMIEDHLQRDKAHYDAICEKRRKAGMMGGRPRKDVEENQTKAKKTNGFSEKQMKANESKQKQKNPNTRTRTRTRTNTRNDKEKVNCRETPPPIAEIIDYLNEKCGTHYRSDTSVTKRFIGARLKEGFVIDNFKRVIDIKASQWLKDPKMRGYLRPETLFAASHFESYLNEAIAEKPQAQQSSLSERLARENEANFQEHSSDDCLFN